MEKQAYALVRSLKDFRVYILHSHVIAFLPNIVVKDILTQPNHEVRRGKWVAILLECLSKFKRWLGFWTLDFGRGMHASLM